MSQKADRKIPYNITKRCTAHRPSVKWELSSTMTLQRGKVLFLIPQMIFKSHNRSKNMTTEAWQAT